MNDYTEADVLLLAKRWQNSKRSYLLVNPLQAKHCPSDPGQALAMMRSLGRQVAEHYPQARLVIGFAETATAIGATLASCLGPDCWYIQTTRENTVTRLSKSFAATGWLRPLNIHLSLFLWTMSFPPVKPC